MLITFTRTARRLGALALAGALSAVPAGGSSTAPSQSASYVPQRVFDAARGGFTDFESMLADLARADVVFIGEQHDDPNTHRLELAVLEGLARRRDDAIVSLEMFERDVQEALDRLRQGALAEQDFLESARPWPRYATDYKPLVDLAIARGWPVIAANVPRTIAGDVARDGTGVLDAKDDEQTAWFAADRQCPTGDDEYYRRFVEAMTAHPSGGDAPDLTDEQAERYYLAQCLKDETMAESIATAYGTAAATGGAPLVVHVNGAFHSDFGLGTAARVRRRLPDQRAVILTILPVADLDDLAPDEHRRRADYLVFTLGAEAGRLR